MRPSDQSIGLIAPSLAEEYGFSSECTVDAGCGDNMYGAIGTGNVTPGIVTISLGTSGTAYTCTEEPYVDPDGEIASFCTIWYDDVTRTAYIEPVATIPEHLRRGLARATLTEGLQRLQELGAVRAFVGGYEPAANALYASTLSPVHASSQQWIKKW